VVLSFNGPHPPTVRTRFFIGSLGGSHAFLLSVWVLRYPDVTFSRGPSAVVGVGWDLDPLPIPEPVCLYQAPFGGRSFAELAPFMDIHSSGIQHASYPAPRARSKNRLSSLLSHFPCTAPLSPDRPGNMPVVLVSRARVRSPPWSGCG